MNRPFKPQHEAHGPAPLDAEEPISGLLPGIASNDTEIAVGAERFLTRFRRNLAVVDYVCGAYLVVLMGFVLTAQGPGREKAIATVVFDIAVYGALLLVTRGGVLREGSLANALLYRLAIYFPLFFSYFQMKWIAPAVSPHSLDGDLLAFDLKVFGYEPAVAWDKYVTPHTTEWFSFFYFGYFFLLCLHVLPIMLNTGSRFRIAHFALGAALIIAPAHILYLLVPGFGPYHYLAGQFAHELEGGLFLRLVKATVEAGGSQKDIFPSLHTAIPTFFATFSFIHRRSFPWRYWWPVMMFTASQIVIATMFLRWHYLIDIIAGLTLSISAAFLSLKITRWEFARRRERGVRPTFSLLEWPWRGSGPADEDDRSAT
ncbi:MAG: phosphatase PAP2 family protein [Deltaproteobacteria bacterium]|nr:phosphatase PAP2 family protein [Deltaproteobacteria bacterium]